MESTSLESRSIRDLFNCPLCAIAFSAVGGDSRAFCNRSNKLRAGVKNDGHNDNLNDHAPVILPCGKTVCSSCIAKSIATHPASSSIYNKSANNNNNKNTNDKIKKKKKKKQNQTRAKYSSRSSNSSSQSRSSRNNSEIKNSSSSSSSSSSRSSSNSSGNSSRESKATTNKQEERANPEGQFTCECCSREHHLTSDGFPFNEVLLVLLKSSDHRFRSTHQTSTSTAAAAAAIEILSKKTTKRSSSCRHNNNSSDNNESGIRRQRATSRSAADEKRRQMSFILNEIELNTDSLEASLCESRRKLAAQFTALEADIETRTAQLADELQRARAQLVAEVRAHKTRALASFDGTNSSNSSSSSSNSSSSNSSSAVQLFRAECKRNYARLFDAAKLPVVDANELRTLVALADELNDRVRRVKLYVDNCVRVPHVRLVKPPSPPSTTTTNKTTVGNNSIGALIGKLEFAGDADFLDFSAVLKGDVPVSISSSNSSSNSNALATARSANNPTNTRLKTIGYKIPFNTKNVLLSVMYNKRIVKATEVADIDDFSFTVRMQLLSAEGVVLHKCTDQVGSYRMRQLQTSAHTNQQQQQQQQHIYTGMLLVNKFFESYSLLKLYDAELRPLRSVELHYVPIALLLSDQAVYVRSHNYNLNVSKYTYQLEHVRSFGQSHDETAAFYVPRAWRLAAVLGERLYWADQERGEIRVMSEPTGKCVAARSLRLACSGTNTNASDKRFLTQVDAASERLLVLNRKLMCVSVYNWDNMLLYERKLDARILACDQFFVLRDGQSAVVDKKNQAIHFF